MADAVVYDERRLSDGLPELLAAGGGGGGVPAVVACHACAHLTLQIVALSAAASSPVVAVMPCCHSAAVVGSKAKAAADALQLPLGVFADIALYGALGARWVFQHSQHSRPDTGQVDSS